MLKSLSHRPSSAAERRARLRLLFKGPFYMRRAAEREACILAFICMADMYTTLFWVVCGYATEANHLLAWTFDIHPLTFVLVKSASCLPAILLAPHLAKNNKTFTIWLLRAIIVIYVYSYLKYAQF